MADALADFLAAHRAAKASDPLAAFLDQRRGASGFHMLPQPPGPWREGYVGALPPPHKMEFKDFSASDLAKIPWEAQARMFNTARDRERMLAAQAGIVAGAAGGGVVGAGLGALAPAAVLPTRLAIGALSGTGAGVAQGAAEAAVEGRPIRPAAIRSGAAGTLMGVGGQALGEGAAAIGGVLRRTPVVGRFLRGQDEGIYAQPEFTELPKHEEGVREAANRGFGRIVNRKIALKQEAGQRYQSDVSPHLGEEVDSELLRGRLLAGRQANIDPDTGMPVNETIESQYGKALDKTPLHPTVEGALKRRRGMQQAAAFGNLNPTDEQIAARDVYHSLRRGIHEASPQVAAADRGYAKWHAQEARGNQLLFNTEQDVIRNGGQLHETPIEPEYPELPAAEVVQPMRATGTGPGYDTTIPSNYRPRTARTISDTIDERTMPGVRTMTDAKNTTASAAAHEAGGATVSTMPDIEARRRMASMVYPPQSAPQLRPAPAIMEMQPPAEHMIAPAKERQAVTFLSRVGDTNVPGTAAQKYIQELGRQDPEFAAAIEYIANKKAQEATRFAVHAHMPADLHGAIEAAGFGGVAHQNVRAAAAHVVDPLMATIAAFGRNPIARAMAIKMAHDAQLADRIRGYDATMPR